MDIQNFKECEDLVFSTPIIFKYRHNFVHGVESYMETVPGPSP